MTRTKTTQPLTAREFVLAAAETYRCPYCGAADVTWAGVDVVGSSAYQLGRCGTCGKTTTAIFRLVGYLRGDDIQTIAEDFGELGAAPARPVITVDYRRLDRQIRSLSKAIPAPAARVTAGQLHHAEALEGLHELLSQIYEQRPFPEGTE